MASNPKNVIRVGDVYGPKPCKFIVWLSSLSLESSLLCDTAKLNWRSTDSLTVDLRTCLVKLKEKVTVSGLSVLWGLWTFLRSLLGEGASWPYELWGASWTPLKAP